jgi:hypothetical protein
VTANELVRVWRPPWAEELRARAASADGFGDRRLSPACSYDQESKFPLEEAGEVARLFLGSFDLD